MNTKTQLAIETIKGNLCIECGNPVNEDLRKWFKQKWVNIGKKDKSGKHSVKFGIYGIPESILINKELVIIQKFVGPLSVDDYNNIIKIIEQL